MSEPTATAIVGSAIKANISHKIAQTGAAGSVIFGLTLNEWGVLVGIVIAVSGFAMQWYYRRKEYKLKAKYFAKYGVQSSSFNEFQ